MFLLPLFAVDELMILGFFFGVEMRWYAGAKVFGGSCEHFVWGIVCKCFVSVWLLGMSSLVLAPRFSMKGWTSETCRGTDVVAQSVVTLVSEQEERKKKDLFQVTM